MDGVVYFWKPHAPNGWMSNWSAHGVSENGVDFATAEHYMMWRKAMAMGDEKTAAKILVSKTPGDAKKLGRSVKPWDEAKWLQIRSEVMEAALRLKTQQHAQIKKSLLQTGDACLAEASPFDAVWGIGCSEDNAKEGEWRGMNLLGKAWMRVRSEL